MANATNYKAGVQHAEGRQSPLNDTDGTDRSLQGNRHKGHTVGNKGHAVGNKGHAVGNKGHAVGDKGHGMDTQAGQTWEAPLLVLHAAVHAAQPYLYPRL